MAQNRSERIGVLLWYRLARFYHNSNKRSNEHLKQWNLSIAQFDLLVQIGVHQPLSQQELAERLLVTKGNITHSVVKLEELGLVKRSQEWRTKLITLTEKGNTLYKEITPIQQQFQSSQFDSLTLEEKERLLELLGKLTKKKR